MKKVTLEVTALESQVLTALAKEMYGEFSFSDVGPTEIETETGIEMKRLRGVLGSLVNKGFVEIDHREDEGYGNQPKMWICYLMGGAEGLVEDWRDESQVEATLVVKD